MQPELDRSVPVVVLKTTRNVLQHGMLGIVRSLGKLNTEVFASVEDGWSPVTRSRYLKRSFPVEGDEQPLLAYLSQLGQQLGSRAIAIPTDDRASIFLAENASRLANWFILPKVPKSLPRRLANKRDLYFLCRDVGVPCPETAVPRSLDDVLEYASRARFPVAVKAVEPQRMKQGVRSVSIVQTEAELVSVYRQAANAKSDNLILQEFIPAEVGEDWIFQGYCNPQSNCYLAFTGRKLRSYPVFAGITTLGVSIRNEPLVQQTEHFLKAIEYAGIMDIDYRLDKRDGKYKLLDFNPRPGANFRMFETAEGVDVVRALHLDLTGRSFHELRTVEGRRFVVEPYDLLAGLGYWRRKSLTVGEWWRSLRGVPWELAWFSWDDPAPFVMMCIWLLARGARRALQSMSPRGADRPRETNEPLHSSRPGADSGDRQAPWDESSEAEKVATSAPPPHSSLE